MKLNFSVVRAVVATALVLIVSQGILAQRKGTARATRSAGPTITQIDIAGLKKAITPNGKPLLINFWATWCDPCREEFPDLVKINEAYKGKIDFITISLDDLADIRGDVPKFLTEMKAGMPAFLLRTPDEDAAIKLVAADWSGSLPMTVLLNADGSKAYSKMGKIKPPILTAEIDKLVAPPTAKSAP
jgi:thiol-disulfide isomerase/thioredoxin